MVNEHFTAIHVGKPAPFNVPEREGCLIEIGYPTNGLNVLVQYPNLNRAELKALQSPLVGYSYYESETIVPIAYWIFQFPRDMYVETTFNACFALQRPEYLVEIMSYMSVVKNGITFFVLDRQVVKAVRVIGLHNEAVQLFHNTLNKQLGQQYSNEDYMLTMKQMESAVSIEELYNMGRQFKF